MQLLPSCLFDHKSMKNSKKKKKQQEIASLLSTVVSDSDSHSKDLDLLQTVVSFSDHDQQSAVVLLAFLSIQ